MGHSKAEKAESHDRIVKTAANLFRELGVDGIGLADLMQHAGLTHGGFYRHFGSRDDLVAEAVRCALADGSAAVDAVTASSRSAFSALVDAYLSLAHRDNLASSCAVTALANDVARSGDRARSAYTAQVEHYVALLASNDPGEQPQKGGLLVAQYGKGYYVYTGYAFFRQLPFGVPGAIRLYVNLLSVGHGPK